MVLDDLHTRFGASRARQAAAKQFIERYLGANDLVADRADRRRGKTQPGVHQQPRAAAGGRRQVMGSKARFGDARPARRVLPDAAARGEPRDRPTTRTRCERGFNARNTLATLQATSPTIWPVRGRRKAIVFVSEGIDYDITRPDSATATRPTSSTRSSDADCRGDARQRQLLRRRPARADRPRRRDASRSASLPDDPTLDLGTGVAAERAAAVAGQPARALRRDRRLRRRQPATTFAAAFERIVQDNSSYYVLGYYPTDDQARRPLPQDRRPGEAAGPEGARAQGLRRAEAGRRKAARRPPRSADPRRRSCARRSTARCRSAA